MIGIRLHAYEGSTETVFTKKFFEIKRLYKPFYVDYCVFQTIGLYSGTRVTILLAVCINSDSSGSESYQSYDHIFVWQAHYSSLHNQFRALDTKLIDCPIVSSFIAFICKSLYTLESAADSNEM